MNSDIHIETGTYAVLNKTGMAPVKRVTIEYNLSKLSPAAKKRIDVWTKTGVLTTGEGESLILNVLRHKFPFPFVQIQNQRGARPGWCYTSNVTDEQQKKLNEVAQQMLIKAKILGLPNVEHCTLHHKQVRFFGFYTRAPVVKALAVAMRSKELTENGAACRAWLATNPILTVRSPE